MAWLFTASGNLKKAEEWIDYANKTAADSLAVQMGSAAWLLEQGRGDEAASHVEAAAKLDPKSNAIKRLMGLAARQRKDFAQAEQIFEGLAHDAPADAWLRNQLALALAEQTDAAKRRRALDLAELSVRQNPKAADSLATLGTVYYRLNRLDDAEKLLAAVFQNGQCQSDGVLALARVEACAERKTWSPRSSRKRWPRRGSFSNATKPSDGSKNWRNPRRSSPMAPRGSTATPPFRARNVVEAVRMPESSESTHGVSNGQSLRSPSAPATNACSPGLHGCSGPRGPDVNASPVGTVEPATGTSPATGRPAACPTAARPT